MDSSSIESMAARLAGASVPEVNPLYELERLIGECRLSLSEIAVGVSEGRFTEEAMTKLWGSVKERARAACEGLRSCKSEIDMVLPRATQHRAPQSLEKQPT